MKKIRILLLTMFVAVSTAFGTVTTKAVIETPVYQTTDTELYDVSGVLLTTGYENTGIYDEVILAGALVFTTIIGIIIIIRRRNQKSE